VNTERETRETHTHSDRQRKKEREKEKESVSQKKRERERARARERFGQTVAADSAGDVQETYTATTLGSLGWRHAYRPDVMLSA
jgi:hypothetical protein